MDESKRKYKKSPKGKEAEKRYNLSEKGHENRRRYNRSEKGKEICRKAARDFYQRNKDNPEFQEKIKERQKIWYLKNHEENKIKQNERTKKYRKTDKGKVAAKNRRARRRQRIGMGRITLEEWNKCIEKYKGKCHLCEELIKSGVPTMDHIIPLSKGGKHEIENVAPAHYKCNVLRKAKSVEEFKKENGYK